jgi:hypothetical protein
MYGQVAACPYKDEYLSVWHPLEINAHPSNGYDACI